MNRIIKFRAWDKELKQFDNIVAGNLLYSLHDEGLTQEDKHRFVLTEYIGLNDINGREIFEGDIIVEYPENRQTTYLGEGNPLGFSDVLPIYEIRDDLPRNPLKDVIINKGIVVYTAPDFRFKYLEKTESGAVSCCLYFNQNYEVVGNIFENPKLIK